MHALLNGFRQFWRTVKLGSKSFLGTWPYLVYRSRESVLIARYDFTSARLLKFAHGNSTVTIDSSTKVHKGVRFFLRGGSIQIGRNCTINEFAIITSGADISIHDNVTLDRFATLQSDQASLSVGSDTTIGQCSHLWAHTGDIRLGARNTLGKSNTWVGTGSGIVIADQCDFGDHVTVDSSGGRISIAEG